MPCGHADGSAVPRTISTRRISSFTVTFVLPSQSPTHWIGVAAAVTVAVPLGWPGGDVADGAVLAVPFGVDIAVGVPLAVGMRVRVGVSVTQVQHWKRGRQIASGPHCGF